MAKSSWFRDPQLFISNSVHTELHDFAVYRCKKELRGLICATDLQSLGIGLSKCLSLEDKKESDFDALLAYLIDFSTRSGSRTWRFVNCHGLAIIWDESSRTRTVCSWAREPLESPFYKIPGINQPVDAEKEALWRRVSELESRISTLEADVQRKNDEKQDLENQVSELTSKLKNCSGSADEEPWKSGNSTVPVNVEKLIPGKGKAPIDPNIWGSYNDDAGTSYAARKLSELEM